MTIRSGSVRPLLTPTQPGPGGSGKAAPAPAGARGPFRGFPQATFAFLVGLSRNNTKAWFDAHRDVYEAAVVEPALAFVEALGRALRTIAPSVRPEPRIGGSLFRPYRDTRFSADKRPYKTHVGIRLSAVAPS